MKKIIMFLMASVLLLGATSCTSCNGEKQKMETMVEQTIKSDRAYMCDHYGCIYRYYETQLVLNEYLDEEGCTGTVDSVTNVFQIVYEYEDGGYNPIVVIFGHSPDAFTVKEVEGPWLEDEDMSGENIAITYRQAYERMMQSNYPKPHSRNCTLRKEVGPYDCNPQYIFGNVDEQLYVDAKTGSVSDKSPAFNPIK